MELTSPLTTLATISTPDSYYTARGSSNAADDTTLSSPIEDPPEHHEELGYRDAVQLPHELKSHCQIHLEEQLYSAAIHILSGLLSDGNTANPPTSTLLHQKHKQKKHTKPKPARIPPPSQLALLATLIIHPSFTSRALETSNVHAAAHALAYLRGLLNTVGPINANLRTALEFNSYSSRTHTTTLTSKRGGNNNNKSKTTTGTYSYSGSPTSGSDSDAHVGGQFAREQLVFRRAPDFWAVLGWALRCAAEHPHRWRHWRGWLEFVVGALEADWDERLERDRESGRTSRGGKMVTPYPVLRGSLVVAYLGDLMRERKNVLREVLRAVFAFSDGEVASDRAMFKEVFERETVVGKGKSKRKRAEAVVDIENEEYGDYLDGDESEEEEGGEGGLVPAAPRGRRKPGRTTKNEPTTTFCLTDDIAETVPFRLRIFRLLSAASFYLPDAFVPVDEFYEKFTDHVRGLPLLMFRLFIESHRSILPEHVQVSFLRMTIEDMLPRHPDPSDVDPDGGCDNGVTVLIMQKCFLPFPANKVTAEDNAKLSLALESLLWFVYSQIEVDYSEGLRRAVETGIKAREDKIKRRGGAAAKADASDKAAREVLARSARSLRVLVDVIAAGGCKGGFA